MIEINWRTYLTLLPHLSCSLFSIADKLCAGDSRQPVLAKYYHCEIMGRLDDNRPNGLRKVPLSVISIAKEISLKYFEGIRQSVPPETDK